MATIAVTGANGFVGSHILEALRAAEGHGLRVVAGCRAPERLPSGPVGDLRVGDLRDAAYRRELLQGVEVLCHAAAWTSAWNHARESDRWFLQPTLALIQDAMEAGVRRFVFLSSTSVNAPVEAADPMSRADPEALGCWPHLRNVARIENALRARASAAFGVVNLRVGLFAGPRYGLGLLPLLVPRLKTRLVPWVSGGNTSLPIVAGADIGRAFVAAARAGGLGPYEAFQIVGPEVPRVREVLEFLHRTYGLPLPRFNVSFPMAYRFARLMELLDPLVPWSPLITRSMVHLLEETAPSNARAEQRLGYRPQVPWQEAIQIQMAEMSRRQRRPMAMHKPLES